MLDDKTKQHIESLYEKIDLQNKLLDCKNELNSHLSKRLNEEEKVSDYLLTKFVNNKYDSKLLERIVEDNATIRELREQNNELNLKLISANKIVTQLREHNKVKGYGNGK